MLPSGSDLLLAASAQMWPFREMSIGGVTYRVAVNGKHLVAYLATSDPNFRSPEGLSVGSTLEQVLATGAQAPGAEPGWAYHTKLPSGWSAAFISGPGLTVAPLQADAKVSWFFKR